MTFLQIGGGMWAAKVGERGHAILTRSQYIGGTEWSILSPAPRRIIASGWNKRLTDAARNARRYFEGRACIGSEEDAQLEALWNAAMRTLRESR